MSVKNSKELANKYWQDMEVLLDKEMPVKRSRRRLLFIFLCGSLGAFLLMGSIILFNDPSTERSLPVTSPKDELIEIDQNLANVKSEGIKSVTDLSSKTTFDKTYHQNEVCNIDNRNTLNPYVKTAEDRGEVPLESFNKIMTQIIVANENQSLNNDTKSWLLSNQDISKDEIEKISETIQLNQLKSMKPNIFVLNHTIIPHKLLESVNTRRLFKFGIETSAISYDLKTVSQYKIGLISQFPLQSRLYGLVSINYSQFNKNQDFTQKILSSESIDRSILENIYSTPLVNTATTNSAQGLQELDIVNEITNKLHYAMLQLGLGYSLNQKWSIESSVHYHRLISANYKSNPILNESLRTLGFVALDQNTLDTKEAVHKKSLLAIGIDIQYSLSNQCSLGLEGNWWPYFNKNKLEEMQSSTSLDATQKILSTINNQSSSVGTGIKIRCKF